MIIKSITLYNFKNFEGKHSIDLAPDSTNSRNIILIGGANGVGKTTLLDAVRLCMFGKRFNAFVSSNNDYREYLFSCKNWSSAKKNDPQFYIQMEIELNESFPHYSLTLKREWKLNRDKMNELFIILRDRHPLEIIPREYWEDYITSLIPPYVSDYFFFDGQRVKELAAGDNAEKILKESIRDLIGLNLYRILHRDLESLATKIRRKNISQENLKDEIERQENEILVLNKKIRKTKRCIQINRGTILRLSSELEATERELKRTAGAYARDRKNNSNELLKLKQKLNTLDDEIKQVCGEVLPYIIASNVCDDLLHQLKKERRLKELAATKDIIVAIKKKIIKKINADKNLKKYSDKIIDTIKEKITAIISEMQDKCHSNCGVHLIHDLTNAEIDVIETFLNKEEKKLKSRLNSILKQREEYILKVRKIKRKLKAIPDEISVHDHIENITSVRTKIELLEQANSNLEIEKQSFEEKTTKIKNIIKEMEEKVVCAEEDKKKVAVSIEIQNVINEFIDTVIPSKIDKLENIVTKMYRKLTNKEDMVKKIKIDKQKFLTTLLAYDGSIVSKNYISEGEKEIYALSILWGLSQISNRRLPVIIDSPLEKLDKTHVDNIITNFFPGAGEQVIILAHDREIDRNAYLKLKPNINKSYILSLDNKNKIKDGYFFGV